MNTYQQENLPTDGTSTNNRPVINVSTTSQKKKGGSAAVSTAEIGSQVMSSDRNNSLAKVCYCVHLIF